MILVDIDILRELTAAMSAVTDEIDNSADALNSISVHNDWGCKEKTAINNYSITNKNKVKQLQENSRNFLNAILKSTNDFEDSENQILGLFSTVDSMISDAIRVSSANIKVELEPIGSIVENISQEPRVGSGISQEQIISILKDILDGQTGWESSINIEDICVPISICNFEDITLE